MDIEAEVLGKALNDGKEKLLPPLDFNLIQDDKIIEEDLSPIADPNPKKKISLEAKKKILQIEKGICSSLLFKKD